MSDALADLSAQGVSIWLDDISRERLSTGNLKQLVDTKHVVGVTSNPTIFQKAMEKGTAYDEQIRDLGARGVSLDESVRLLTGYDIRWACDVLRPTYDRTNGLDGRVSSSLPDHQIPTNLSIGKLILVASLTAVGFMAPQPHITIQSGRSRRTLSHRPDWCCISAAGTGYCFTVKP